MIFEWGTSPPKRHRAWRWGPVVENLQTRPGEWAQIATRETANYAYGSARRQLRMLGCEVECRQRDGLVDVWARWPGVSTEKSPINAPLRHTPRATMNP